MLNRRVRWTAFAAFTDTPAGEVDELLDVHARTAEEALAVAGRELVDNYRPGMRVRYIAGPDGLLAWDSVDEVPALRV